MPFVYRREPLSRSEVEQLFRACSDSSDVAILRVFLDTGLRVSEFCRLTPDDFDYQSRSLRVHGKRGPHGTKQPVRHVPVTDPTTRAALESILSLGANRLHPRTIQRFVARLARAAGLRRKVTPHVLRHTFAVEATRRGVSLAALQRALGHDHLSSTQVYQNLSAADVVEEFERKW